jgi:hypothetical protein
VKRAERRASFAERRGRGLATGEDPVTRTPCIAAAELPTLRETPRVPTGLVIVAAADSRLLRCCGAQCRFAASKALPDSPHPR